VTLGGCLLLSHQIQSLHADRGFPSWRCCGGTPPSQISEQTSC